MGAGLGGQGGRAWRERAGCGCAARAHWASTRGEGAARRRRWAPNGRSWEHLDEAEQRARAARGLETPRTRAAARRRPGRSESGARGEHHSHILWRRAGRRTTRDGLARRPSPRGARSSVTAVSSVCVRGDARSRRSHARAVVTPTFHYGRVSRVCERCPPVAIGGNILRSPVSATKSSRGAAGPLVS